MKNELSKRSEFQKNINQKFLKIFIPTLLHSFNAISLFRKLRLKKYGLVSQIRDFKLTHVSKLKKKTVENFKDIFKIIFRCVLFQQNFHHLIREPNWILFFSWTANKDLFRVFFIKRDYPRQFLIEILKYFQFLMFFETFWKFEPVTLDLERLRFFQHNFLLR